ncbi:helix-turn-helix domain-containing protein [Corynebacterium sp. SCR221107]|uniref:helix-turn-helix transcriptional regulator n=1 Tax=Corynebacterium sp. SCR221107 TaxID=3017361 RepID=UPI0022EC25D4|nr:helix-turn-helix domain-containing protein [Corynebacterium sp. SCR221107]WBT08121.1 helix-turn-helix domain-containing protein [Corynebacterium sp. SCR221107]
MTTNRMLTAAQAAERIGVTTRTLFTYRKEGTGPTYVRYSAKTVKYPENELNEWIAARTVKAGGGF